MVNLSEHIEYLLREHECVVVPDLGAFLSHYESARLSDDERVIYPPRRVVSFSAEVRRSDGLLVGSVARRQGVSFERGRQIVSEEVESLRHQLTNDGELMFEGVGRLSLGEDGTTPTFEPAKRSKVNGTNVLFTALSTQVERAADETESVTPPPFRLQQRKPRRVGKWISIAAMIAVLMGLGVIGLKISERPDNVVNQASLAPSTTVIKPSRAVTAESTESSTTFEGVLSIAVPGSDSKTEVSVAEQEAPTADKYYLVIASLRSERQARRFIARMGDPTLKILEVDGKYRVYAAEAATFAGASAYKNVPHIAKRYKDSWVCTSLR